MATLLLTLAINLDPRDNLFAVAAVLEEHASDAAEHLRKCDCDRGFSSPECAQELRILEALEVAIDEEAHRWASLGREEP